MEKAYDTTWWHGILRDLSGLDIRAKILNAIESYLSNRIFRVRIGKALSRPFVQETGVPQDGVLSRTLYLVKMNYLRSSIPRTIFSLRIRRLWWQIIKCDVPMWERPTTCWRAFRRIWKKILPYHTTIMCTSDRSRAISQFVSDKFSLF